MSKLIMAMLFGVFVAPQILAQSSPFDEATVTFEFVSRGVSGTLGDFKSKTKINWTKLDESYFEGSVAAGSIDTNNWLRDWHLKSKKYFHVDAHPRIVFKGQGLVFDDFKLHVKGVLSLKGIQKPLTLTFEKVDNTLVGKANLYSSDYGIEIKKQREDNLVRVQIVFEMPTIFDD